jgi:hypothetical protein
MSIYNIFALGVVFVISYTGGVMVKDYIQMKYHHVKKDI